MPRKWEHDGDDALVSPSGCVRCGYDADTQTYLYEHPNGDLYKGPPGATYGPLRLVSSRGASTSQRNTETTRYTSSPGSQRPPAYTTSGSSPPPYSPSSPAKGASQAPPAVTFDEILTRHPSQNDKSREQPSERELQSALASNMNMGPKRSVSLRSIFGPRRGGSNTGNGRQQPPSGMLSRRATMGDTYSSYGR